MACAGEASPEQGRLERSPEQDRPDEANRSPEQDRLDAARTLWEASGIDDYEWTYQRICFCFSDVGTTAARVEGGVVVSAEAVKAPEGFEMYGADEDPEPMTVPELFDLVQEGVGADALQVEYDPRNGRVRSLFVDPNEDMTDDELTLVVHSFET